MGFGVAKGFHLAAGVPLIGVPTLEATALAFVNCMTPIVAVVGAGRGRLVWARYEASSEGLTQSHVPRNGTVGELTDELNGSGPVLITGEFDEDQAGHFALIDGVSMPPRPCASVTPERLPSLPGGVGRLGRSMMRERLSRSTSRADRRLTDT